MIVTGLRGIGKTVLLAVFREKAEVRDWATVEWKVEKNAAFALKIAAHVRRALLQIAPKAGGRIAGCGLHPSSSRSPSRSILMVR